LPAFGADAVFSATGFGGSAFDGSTVAGSDLVSIAVGRAT
jgi:hypothetical protein